MLYKPKQTNTLLAQVAKRGILCAYMSCFQEAARPLIVPDGKCLQVTNELTWRLAGCTDDAEASASTTGAVACRGPINYGGWPWTPAWTLFTCCGEPHCRQLVAALHIAGQHARGTSASTAGSTTDRAIQGSSVASELTSARE